MAVVYVRMEVAIHGIDYPTVRAVAEDVQKAITDKMYDTGTPKLLTVEIVTLEHAGTSLQPETYPIEVD